MNYVDRFLSVCSVSESRLRLLGLAAVSVSVKYEEEYLQVPFKNLCSLCDGQYCVDMIRRAEQVLLKGLNWELGWPGPLSFLKRINKLDESNEMAIKLAQYILETTLLDETFIAEPPSLLAAAAYCLARNMLKMGGWVNIILPSL